MATEQAEAKTLGQPFHYHPPTEPIIKNGFHRAFWGNVPKPVDLLPVRGMFQTVEVFGFQGLEGEGMNEAYMPASIEMHPEMELTELTYPIQGVMDMTIESPYENPVISRMMPVVPTGIDLRDAIFNFDEHAQLIIDVDGQQYILKPTITPVGASHATSPITNGCVYLAVKVKPQINMLEQIHRDLIM